MDAQDRFVLVNTIGGTLPDLVAAELSRFNAAAVLPGLSFARQGTRLYRRHDLTGLSPEAIFDHLWAPSYEPGGRLWAGTLRDFDACDRATFPVDKLRRTFADSWHDGLGYLGSLELFCRSYFAIRHTAPRPISIIVASGPPFVKTVPWDEIARTGAILLDVTTSPSLWLAIIGFGTVVNPHLALSYWIANRLVVASARKSGVCVIDVDLLEALREPSYLAQRLAPQVMLDCETVSPCVPPGYRVADHGRLATLQTIAADVAQLYSGDPLYETARAVDRCAAWLLSHDEIESLIPIYLAYWDSTGHIHFDSDGLIERRIAERAAKLYTATMVGKSPDRSSAADWAVSRDFYHGIVNLDGNTWYAPQVRLTSALGSIEERIILPRGKFFLAAVLAYLDAVASVQAQFPDSYDCLTQRSLYRRITATPYCDDIHRLGLDSRLQQIQQRVMSASQQATQASCRHQA